MLKAISQPSDSTDPGGHMRTAVGPDVRHGVAVARLIWTGRAPCIYPDLHRAPLLYGTHPSASERYSSKPFLTNTLSSNAI